MCSPTWKLSEPQLFWVLYMDDHSSANKDSYFSSFPICVPFISFSCLIALSRTSRTMLKSSGEKGHPYLGPDLSGNVSSFSLLSRMFAISFCRYYLSNGSVPLCSSLLTVFQFFFSLPICWITLSDFSNVEAGFHT